MTQVLKPLVLVCTGTSLTAGRLSADWVARLNAAARAFPEAKGPVIIYNMGHGGWTSTDLLADAPNVVALKPTHILAEGGAINDCFDIGAGPAVSRATHNANNAAMINLWKSAIPGVDITLQTMSSVSPNQTGRTLLATYYADEMATAAALGVRADNNYANWPKPLPQALTYVEPATGLGDGLHPIWTGAVENYFYPVTSVGLRTVMAAYWPN